MMRAVLLMLMLLCWPAVAPAMERLSDTALARVRAADGISFNLSGFSMAGNAELRYFTARNDASFSIGNLAASRSDNPDGFADPYRLDVVHGAPGRADIVNLARPLNAGGKELWQIAYDFGVRANGLDVNGGAVVLTDLAFYGGGLQWSTPTSGDGMAFGVALRSELGSLSLRPNGRAAADESMTLAGVRIGAVDAAGRLLSAPWRIADVTRQPGIFNARTDAAGQSSLHLGIDWPDAGGADRGTMQVDQISFRSNVTGTTSLGAARIGSIQLQYLDIKFRP